MIYYAHLNEKKISYSNVILNFVYQPCAAEYNTSLRLVVQRKTSENLKERIYCTQTKSLY